MIGGGRWIGGGCFVLKDDCVESWGDRVYVAQSVVRYS
eukprot:COSAG01_NODE_72020_length_254_cov_0.670968_1_plen_37_part_10